jgi:hypothetical protein
MALTDSEKSRARHHLGYGEVMESQTFVMGIPAGVQTQFVIEGGLNRIMPSGEARFRKVLDSLNRVECRIEESTEDVEVESLGDIKVNAKAFQRLLERYRFWQGALANIMQVPPNPFDQRFSGYGAGPGGINVPVTG